MIYKIGLALALAMLICLFPMPYGYYTLVRFATMIVMGIMAFVLYDEKRLPLAIVAGSIALLFQPIVKIVLDRTTWNILDVVVAILLVIIWLKECMLKKI